MPRKFTGQIYSANAKVVLLIFRRRDQIWLREEWQSDLLRSFISNLVHRSELGQELYTLLEHKAICACNRHLHYRTLRPP